MLIMHCPQCGSEYPASATQCQRCGRAIGGMSSWATPRVANLAQAVEHFRDEVKAAPLPQANNAEPLPVARQPLTLAAQWSTVSPEPFASPAPEPGFFPSMSSTSRMPSTPPPLDHVSPVTVFREGENRIELDNLPADHWSRQSPQDEFSLPKPFSAPVAPPKPLRLPPPIPAAHELPDVRALHEAVQSTPKKTPLLVQAAAILLAIGLGVGISAYLFGRPAESKDDRALSAEQLRDMELTGFRLRRIDSRGVQVRFLVVNHGTGQAGRTKLSVTLRAGHDKTYTFDAKVPSVNPGEISEVTTRVEAPVSLDESADWQRVTAEFHNVK